MFYSETLLAKEGPLAEIWLAANLEKKLSKQQFLQTNIVESTKAIANATSEDSEALALRLSGQLLYGVVRIYSRKAKYLLDDVSDALLKLKSAIRSSSNTILLPANSTIIPTINQITLQDTVTTSDLLYQEPLTFDDLDLDLDATSNKNRFDEVYDQSIEIPRNDIDELDGINDDFDMDLNFDMEGGDDGVNDNNEEADRSIEIGRAIDDANLSVLEGDGFADDLDLGFGNEPIELVEKHDELSTNNMDELPLNIIKKKRKPRAKNPLSDYHSIISDDDKIEISIEEFRDCSSLLRSEQQEKLNKLKDIKIDSFINEDVLMSLMNKRQKTVHSDDDEPVPELIHENANEEENGDDSENLSEFDHGNEFDQSMEMNFDFDIDNERVLNPEFNIEQENLAQEQGNFEYEKDDDLENFTSISNSNNISKFTVKVANEIKNELTNNVSTNFTKIYKNDFVSNEPLSKIPKSEATRIFFELLVLSNSDAISLKQDDLFGEIKIKSKDALFSNFV